MQYKIPVQIENEDTIVLGLSLRQLAIIIAGGAIGYSVFTSLAARTDPTIAAFPAIVIVCIAVIIAVFKHSEMTFVPFTLALLRKSINPSERTWQNTVDAFQPMDIGFITNIEEKKDKGIDTNPKLSKLQDLEDKLQNI